MSKSSLVVSLLKRVRLEKRLFPFRFSEAFGMAEIRGDRNAFLLKEWMLIVSILPIFSCYRRIIWNFFRLENEHLNNCGNFRAVRDIGIAPIRKETSPPPVMQEGDKAYGMFSQLYTLNQNNNNGSNDNHRDSDEINQGFDAGGSGDSGGVAMENAPLPSTLAEYATMLRQNNQKSLWNHLRENYLQTKKEKRRRLEFDRIVSMEEALRAAKMDVQVAFFLG